MDVKADDIKKLRDLTNAGMMDCKKALIESKGDFTEAVDFLRKKGLSIAASRAGKTASEGVIAVFTKGDKGALIELNAETDFVARNQDFQTVAFDIVKVACEKQLDHDALLQAAYPGKDCTVEKAVTDLISIIKENIKLSRSMVMHAHGSSVVSYVHNAYANPCLGKIGVLVALEGDAQKAQDVGRKVAMHIAATKPKAMTIDKLSAKDLEHEKMIYTEQAKLSGKPDNVIEKMVEGRMRKFYEEVVLSEQPFVMDTSVTVKDFVAQAGLSLKDYCFFILGAA